MRRGGFQTRPYDVGRGWMANVGDTGVAAEGVRGAVATAEAGSPAERDTVVAAVRAVARDELAPLVKEIDLDGLYPEGVLRRAGEAGAFRLHLRSEHGGADDLYGAVEAMAALSEQCLATAFLAWCQDACAWYLDNTRNAALREARLTGVASGASLGATGLSNPMKHCSGIEPVRLKGEQVDGGYRVRGVLPLVSNLGPDHVFGAVFQVDDHQVMALAECAAEGVRLAQDLHFVALEGTRTYSVKFKDVFVPDTAVLAAPAAPFLIAIRPGFVLLQSGMALGLVRSIVPLLYRAEDDPAVGPPPADETAAALEDRLSALGERIAGLCRNGRDDSPAFMKEVFTARLEASELSVKAAGALMIAAGAGGYTLNGVAQRRLREAYFVAVVTPSMKHLRKVLAAP